MRRRMPGGPGTKYLVAGDDVGDDEEQVGADQQHAGDVVQAHSEGEVNERQGRIGEVDAHPGEAEEDDQRGIDPVARSGSPGDEVGAFSHGPLRSCPCPGRSSRLSGPAPARQLPAR